MEIFVALVTISVVALLLAWWPTVRTVAAYRKPAGGILRDSGLGYAQVALLPGWRPAQILNDEAGLQAVDPLRRRYLIVISESREDFKANLTIEDHAALTLQHLAKSVRMVGLSDPAYGKVGDFTMLQYEVEAFSDDTWLKYLHTTIRGRRAFHQVLAWATHSMYDRGTFDALVRGFSELPGPDPVVRSAPPVIPHIVSRSRYDVQ